MTSDSIRERLRHLHDVECISWRKIAEMPEFKEKNIPAGSLCSFAAGWEPKTNEARRKFGQTEIIEISVKRDEKGRFS